MVQTGGSSGLVGRLWSDAAASAAERRRMADDGRGGTAVRRGRVVRGLGELRLMMVL